MHYLFAQFLVEILNAIKAQQTDSDMSDDEFLDELAVRCRRQLRDVVAEL